MTLKTPLSKAKGLGSAKEGSHHWWMQRVTAIALIPLVVWFVSTVIKAGSGQNIFLLLSSPIHAVMMLLFIGVAFYHACIGMRVVIEDYVSCKYMKNTFIILVNFISVALVVASLLAVVTTHVTSKQSYRPGYGCSKGKYGHGSGKGCDKYKKYKKYKNKHHGLKKQKDDNALQGGGAQSL